MAGENHSSHHSTVEYIEIGGEYVGQRIDNFLLRLLKGVPKSHIYRILRSGEVRINKGRVKPAYRVKKGDRVRIPPLRRSLVQGVNRKAPEWLLARLQSAVRLEDDDYILIDKPAGLAVHGGSGIDYGAIELLRQARPNVPLLELGHRLDRDTSGCLLIAKSRPALTELHRLLRQSKVKKHYLALVAGAWSGGMRRVSVPLSKSQHGHNVKAKIVVDAQGKGAETVFKPLRIFSNCSLMEIQIRTGRTHQIRVHAAYIGYPLAGDDKYGDFGFNRQMRGLGLRRMFLHASRMSFQTPRTGKKYRFETPLEPPLQLLLSKLELA
jgi:23S rRNA pseudouridine955/2504/2580 synthase